MKTYKVSDSTVAVFLTGREARCLLEAASQTMDHGDVVEQEFKGADRAAAMRAYAKLREAVVNGPRG